MVDDLDVLIEKIEYFIPSVYDKVIDLMATEKYTNFLIDANKYNLSEGMRSDGTQIEKVPMNKEKSNLYERYTIYQKEKKSGLAGRYDVVTLYNTGTMQTSESIVRSGDEWFFNFLDEKYESLIKPKWGDVSGITQEQMGEFLEIMYIDLTEFTKYYFT